MKEQTAIDWLIEAISKHDKTFIEFYGAEIQQAKTKEEQKIIDAYNDGVKEEWNYEPERHGNIAPTAQQYYDNKYKN